MLAVPCTSSSAVKANSHISCRAPAVPCRANSHMPCCAPAVLREPPSLKSARSGKIRTASRETPRGSQEKPNLGRSPTGRQETANVISHVPCRAHAVLCHGLGEVARKQHGRSTARERHVMCASNTVALYYSNGNDNLNI